MKQYNPFDPAVIQDPYPFYEWLREEAPVYHVEELDLYVLSRYEDVYASLKNPAVFSSQQGMGMMIGAGGPPGKMRDYLLSRNPAGLGGLSPDDLAGLRVLIASDPPDHTRLRRLVSKPFTPKAMTALEPRIREICEALVDDLVAANQTGEADLIKHLAYPLPVIVIAEMLGIPAERRDDFKRWSDDVVGALSSGLRDPERSAQSGMEMFQFFGQAIEERRETPGNDLISLLVTNSEGGDSLNTMEILLFCVLLLIAGNETTTNLISNGALALFDRPQLWKQVRQEPARIPALVEEVLRYDTPVQALFRATTRPVELHGVTLPANAPVLVLFGAANRDPRHYTAASEFQLERNPTDNLSFGAGIHLCLGAPLARMEARIASEVLLRRTRNMRQTSAPTRIDSFLLRGLSHLPIAFESNNPA